ncbi:MAG: glycerophosphodiester phosphodiesterase family protein [Brevefilum sp.]|nr:glycerophosphodiester phosphodiesterase family protein [Brevefilum sp.]MDT8382316.1 glycerophosphodiester phosphodiesterase family protein [Brevefilum sp.]
MVNVEKPKKSFKFRLQKFLALLLLLHGIFYLAYWFSIGNLRGDVDKFIADFIGLTLPYTVILMVLTSLVGIWSLLRFLRLRVTGKKASYDHDRINWIYFGVLIFFLVLFYSSFFLILRENPSQRGVINLLINLIRLGTDPLWFLIAAIGLRKLILLFRGRAIMTENRWPWMIGIGFVLVLLVGLWLLPALNPPNWAYQGDLPAKPALIAHRGASMLAPENTIAAADLAASYEAFGFETDIRISQDGVPLLMHDGTLQRTTNVAEVYTDRAAEDASSFIMEELNNLNAGLWFIQKDPYKAIDGGLVSQAQLSINQGQKIPTLTQALELVTEKDLVFLFDLRYPPEDHPYHDELFDIVFEQCKESGLNGNIWFLVDRRYLDTLLTEAPQMTRVIGASSTNLPDPEELLTLEYEIVNVDMGILKKDIQAYRDEGLGVNVYTIDQPWLFSQFWLSGVTSVTTNNIHTLSQLDRPLIYMPYSRYLLFWGLFGIIVAIWLASSQPHKEVDPQTPRKMKTPDLLDFAMTKEDQLTLDGSKVPDMPGDESSMASVEIDDNIDSGSASLKDIESK